MQQLQGSHLKCGSGPLITVELESRLVWYSSLALFIDQQSASNSASNPNLRKPQGKTTMPKTSWTRPPLHRHLSTIGIGPVFVCPPPHTLPPQPVDIELEVDEDQNVGCDGDGVCVDAPGSDQSRKKIVTWEVVGKIKTSPEDFIVREIAWAPPPPSSSVDKDRGNNDKRPPTDIKHVANKYRRRPGWCRRIAGIECEFQPEEMPYGSGVGECEEKSIASDGILAQTLSTKKRSKEEITAAGTLNLHIPDNSTRSPCNPQTNPLATTQSKQQSVESSSNRQNNDLVHSGDETPKDGLRRILRLCHSKNRDEFGDRQTSQLEHEAAADATLQQLSDLQNLALDEIDSSHSATLHPKAAALCGRKDEVWIPTAQIFQNQIDCTTNNDQGDWKLLHQYIRLAFPLLQTKASSAGPPTKAVGDHASDKNRMKVDGLEDDGPVEKTWVCALVDETFFPIAPSLAKPSEDLLLLYRFRSNGPVPALGVERNGSRARYNHRNRRRKNKEVQKEQPPDGERGENSTHKAGGNPNTQGQVLLRLRPDLPRSERRAIHQTLASSRRRDFETSTMQNVPLDYVGKDSEQTTAIAIQWTQNAIQGCQKKRKRDRGIDDGSTTESKRSSENITASFCILRKEQCEHQVAINQISRALKCRAGDIGLAGIKDMQAVTYQFCTLRGVELKRAQRANNSLGNRVQLLNSVLVQGSDALLDRGKLLGNRFDITIRNMKRVQRLQMEGEESWVEQTIPLHASHFEVMVKRIVDGGFINFYGEQRVGDAGFASYVGVRSFDVGKAMLQKDFSKAIDLIMAGRSSQVYSPSAEEAAAREAWKKTGDARETLSQFPKNRSTMPRERDVMKGMLRYGDALEAIRCINYNVRMFWIHAYQSFVWNRVATVRVKRWGLTPIAGDLYLTGGDDDGATVQVQVVSDPASVNISQIVLPLPGYNMQYPTNEMGEFFCKILSDDGVDLSKNNIPEATAKGSYRKLVQKANRLTWNCIPAKEEEECGEEDPIVSSAKLTFELESGCYATMMLRELMMTTMTRDSEV